MIRKHTLRRDLAAAVEQAGFGAMAAFWLGAAVLMLASAVTDAQAQTTAPPAAAGVVVYPAKGQSAQQQRQDAFECHEWARAQSGFDPSQPSAPAATTGTPSATASAGTMAKGAIGGAAVGEIASNDAGRGAAVGVLGALVREQSRQQKSAQVKQEQAAQQQAARAQQRSLYDRAVAACLQGRGYTVR